ncbi:SDR family oxidoreductase [Notoacmeibacter marinus]|uniref:SDR family oxidoreductase n=1 Tax=Notoacmeibacter marinus TaxID=1876515 RepID=UPI000DF28D52|nr:SDR family oxidoreductase [Notoacmeibacter marinus]
MNNGKSGTAIITGASSGIGAATARSLVAQGYDVVLTARREDRLDMLATELGSSAMALAVDVSDRDGMSRVVAETLRHFGGVDVLINNAGTMPVASFAEADMDDWDRMIDINLKGVLYGIKAVLPHMLRQGGGDIVSIASIAGLRATAINGVYAATKSAVRFAMESLRQETGRSAIRSTIITPGAVDTELEASVTNSNVRQALETTIDFKLLDPSAIADAILYALAQPRNVCIGEIVIRPTAQA